MQVVGGELPPIHSRINSLLKMTNSTLHNDLEDIAARTLLSMSHGSVDLMSSSIESHPPEKNSVRGRINNTSTFGNFIPHDPDTAQKEIIDQPKKSFKEGKRDCIKVPIVVTKVKEEEKIIAQWLKCVKDMTTAKQVRFLGEYVLYQCVNKWHNKSFNLDSFFVFGVSDSELIWDGLLRDLSTVIRQQGWRYASSILRHSKNQNKSGRRSKSMSKLASEWAREAVNTLVNSSRDLPDYGQSFQSFFRKHNQMRSIDDNMETMQRISQAYTRTFQDIISRNTAVGGGIVFKK